MPAPVATTDLPPTCSVKRWVVFGPGMHKDELYSPQRNQQIVRNFDQYSRSGHTVPRVALGHDQQQRFAKSLGFGNVGTITRCALVPGYEDHGIFEIDVDNVPTEVGGEINAGRLPGGSVELKSHQRDPQNASQEIPGDLLTGIAFLGEEQPAVRNFPPALQERSRPHATFADGRPVPPNASPTRWLNAMADVTQAMAAEYRGQYDPGRRALRINGREFSDTAVCFSDFDPQPGSTMTPEEIKAKLLAAGKTQEEVDALLALLGGAAAPPVVPETNPTMSATEPDMPGGANGFAANCRKMADAESDPTKKALFSAFADEAEKRDKAFSDMEKKFSENEKRVGELQASADATRKKDEEAKEAAMSDSVAKAVAPLYRKLPPVAIDAVHKPTLLGLLRSKTFSAETDRVKAFNDYLAPLLALPDDTRLATAPGAPVSGGGHAPGELAKHFASSAARLPASVVNALAKRLAPATN